ncbi:hypothetical protein Tco_0531662 [Tanacetum coccineum]
MYRENPAKFWYSAKALENSKVWVNTFRNAIGAHYLPHSREYVAPPSIDIVRPWFETIGYGETVPAKGTLKKSLLPPREKVVPYTRFLSLLMMHKMKEGYGDGEVTPNPTQVFTKLVVFKAPNPSSNAERVPQGTTPRAKPRHKKYPTSSKQPPVSSSEATKASTPVVAEMHKEDQQATGDLTSLGVTSEERADPQLNSGMSAFNLNEPIFSSSFIIHSESASGNNASAVFTAEADPGKSAPSDFIPQQQAPLLDKLKKAEAEAALLRAQPSFLNMGHLNELLVKSLQTEFSKIIFAYDFSSSLPTEVKELPSKFNELTEEVKGLKKQVHNLEIELPGELKEIPTKLEDFTKTVTKSYIPVEVIQTKLKILDDLPSLLHKVTNALNQFAQAISLKKTEDNNVPSAGQDGTQPAEGEKNTIQTTIS